MSRNIIVSVRVVDKLGKLVAYLKNDLHLSEEAALAYRDRFLAYIQSFGAEVDLRYVDSRNGAHRVTVVPYLKSTGFWPTNG